MEVDCLKDQRSKWKESGLEIKDQSGRSFRIEIKDQSGEASD